MLFGKEENLQSCRIDSWHYWRQEKQICCKQVCSYILQSCHCYALFCAKRLITLQPRVERLFLHLQGSKKYVPVKINTRSHSYIVLIQPQREHHRWHIFGCRYLLHWSLWATAMTSHSHTHLCSRYVTAQVTAVFSWTIGVQYQRWYRRRGGQTRIKEIAEFLGGFFSTFCPQNLSKQLQQLLYHLWAFVLLYH